MIGRSLRPGVLKGRMLRGRLAVELVGILVLVVVLLVPSVRKLIDSAAYRNRAKGKAEIIRAERGVEPERESARRVAPERRARSGRARGKGRADG